MHSKTDSTILEIRSFNRFYTNILGLIDQHILNSKYSLTEARVLFEIDNLEDCSASKLMESLRIDKGYMSRILKRFDKDGLTYKKKYVDDARITLLSLTEKGRSELLKLIADSNLQIQKLVSHLDEKEVKQLLSAMKTIESTLTSESHQTEIVPFDEKDVKHIIKRHAELYEDEYKFNSTFEDYVASSINEFCSVYDSAKENIWVAKVNKAFIGSIGIVKVDEKTAQLRWFLIEPLYRGKGIGKRLMEQVLQFCRKNGYKNVFLWTVNLLISARSLYQKFGFRLTETNEHDIWGQHLTEERWDLTL